MAQMSKICTCGGKLVWEKRLVDIAGRNFGHHDVGICSECSKRFLKDEVIDMIEEHFPDRQD